jgi:hypothetical protein
MKDFSGIHHLKLRDIRARISGRVDQFLRFPDGSAMTGSDLGDDQRSAIVFFHAVILPEKHARQKTVDGV